MEALDTAGWLVDDLLDFSSDIGEEDDEEPKPNQQQEEDEEKNKTLSSSSSLKPTREQALPNIFDPEKDNPLFPVFQEEELEWLSNENIFPSIETCDILSEKPRIDPKHQSPVSILLDSSNLSSSSSSMSSNTTGIMSCCGMLRIPVRARSKRKRRRRSSFVEQKWSFWSEPEKKSGGRTARTTLGRKCTHCLSEKTPQWRAGPLGPKTLCNACGVRFKSGRLMPEYRPASSPTFLTQLHSNSHKKVLEMRRQKQKMTSQSMDTG